MSETFIVADHSGIGPAAPAVPSDDFAFIELLQMSAPAKRCGRILANS